MPHYDHVRRTRRHLASALRWISAFVLVLATGTRCRAQVTFVSSEYGVPTGGLATPGGVAADGQGNLYIADTGNNRVLMVAAAGPQAGVPVTVLEGLAAPNGVTSDWSGNLYIADTGNNRIVVLPLTQAGYGTPIPVIAGLSNPMSVAVDSSGNLYVADTGNNRVVMIPGLAGVYGAPVTITSSVNQPQGIAIDASRDIFIADTGNNRVLELHNSWTGYGQQQGVQYLTAPSAVYVDRYGNLLIAGEGNNEIVMVPWSSGAKRFNNAYPLANDFASPGGVAEDWSGNVYVADSGNNRLRAISTGMEPFGAYPLHAAAPAQTYNFEVQAGTAVGWVGISTSGATSGDFADGGNSTCIAQTYAATTLCNVNLIFTPLLAGQRTGAVALADSMGNPLATAYVSGIGLGAQAGYLPAPQTIVATGLSAPAGVAVDGSENLYIADTGNNRVLELPWNGAGYGAPIPLPIAGLESPMGMAIDGSGTLYVTSNQNDSVIKLPWATSSQAGSFGPQSKVGTALYGPSAVAVSAAGNVLIANTLSNTVLDVPWTGSAYTQESNLGNYHRFPASIATDPLGNVYFASPYTSYVVKIPWSEGQFQTQINLPLNNIVAPAGIAVDANANVFVLDQSSGRVSMLPWIGTGAGTGTGYGTEVTVASGFNAPTAIAVDGFENLFVADTGNNQVVMVSLMAAPTLNFDTTYIGLTSADSAQAVNVMNVGNQPFTVNAMGFAADFPEGPVTASTCAAGLSLQEGGACSIPVNFTPQAAGAPLTESMAIATSLTQTPLAVNLVGTSLALNAQTIQFPALPSVVYGTPMVSLGATASSGLPVSYQVVSGPGAMNWRGNAVNILGVGTIVMQASQAGNSAFQAAAAVTQTLVVTPATLTVTAQNSSMVYGGSLGTLTYAISGFVNGDRQMQVVSGAAAVAATCQASSPAGNYAIAVSAGTMFAANYNFVFVPGTLTITPAVLQVVPVASQGVYGQPLPQATASITGFVNGDTASTALSGSAQLTMQATSQSAPGRYPIVASQGTLSAKNYIFAFSPGMITIGKAVLTVTPIAASMTYGGSLPQLSYVVTGFANGDKQSVVTGAPIFAVEVNSRTPVGVYPVTAAVSGMSAACYSFVGAASTITVNKAQLIVSALNAAMTYGGALPQLGYSITGFLPGDSQSAVVSGAPVVTVSGSAPYLAGSYALTVGPGTVSAANYSFSFVPGVLTVAQAVLTVTANSAAMVYGSAVPALGYSLSGFVAGDTAQNAVAGVPQLATAATPASQPGNYAIAIGSGTLSAANYSFAFVAGTLVVSKRVLTVSPLAAAMTYGDEMPALSYSLSGFVNGDTARAISGIPQLWTQANSRSGVGSYAIDTDATALSSDRYTFRAEAGTLTVNPAVLTVTAQQEEATYGSAPPSLQYKISGFAKGDWEAEAVSGLPQLSVQAHTGSSVGIYPVECAAGTLRAKNYRFVFAAGSLTVKPAALRVAADDLTMVEKAQAPKLTYTAEGLVNGDTLASATSGAPVLTADVTRKTKPGTYKIAIAMGSLRSGNYRIALESGKLTVTE